MKKLPLNACKYGFFVALVLALCPSLAAAECSITTGSSAINYGRVNEHIMRGSAGKQVLAAREVQVNVDCDDAQVMSLRFGSSDPQAFTFGRDGKLDVRLSGLTMDGRAISFLDFTRSEERNRRQQMTSLQPGSQIVTADVGRHLSFKLTLRPIFSHGLFSISDLQEISSDITMSVDD